MAVQQNKKSRSARGMRRSHDALSSAALSVDKTTGETHLPIHHTHVRPAIVHDLQIGVEDVCLHHVQETNHASFGSKCHTAAIR